MKKRCTWILPVTALVGILMFSCAAQNAATPDEETNKNAGPPLQPGQLVESVDAHTVRVMCTGVGDGTKGATVNARQGCLDWFVRTGLGLQPEDIEKYKGMQKEIFAKLDTFIEVPGPARMGGGGKGILSRTTMDANQVRIRCIVDLYKSRLKDHLARSGLGGAAAPGGDKPMVVAILPSKQFQNSTKRQMLQNLIAAHFVENKFKVVDVEDSTLSRDDKATNQAQAAGADVVVVYEAVKQIKGPAMSYTVMLMAFEPSSGRQVGAANALSSERPKILPAAENAAIQEASSDALTKLESQLLAHSNEESMSGAMMRIVIRGAKPNADMKFHQVLKRLCSRASLRANQPGNLEFYARCKMDSIDLTKALGDAIQEKGIAEDFDVLAKTGKLIILQLK